MLARCSGRLAGALQRVTCLGHFGDLYSVVAAPADDGAGLRSGVRGEVSGR
jgi:hypothetical protein